MTDCFRPKDTNRQLDQPEHPEMVTTTFEQRLAQLPEDHPSSSRYWRDATGHEAPPATPAGPLDRAQVAVTAGPDHGRPAGERPEWADLLASGEVDQVGTGIVDERASRFLPAERRLADLLAGEGRAVVAIHDGFGRHGRKPDALVDGVPTEFKTLDRGASHTTVKAALTSARGQARDTVIDGRTADLSREDAQRGIRRFLGTPHAGRQEAIRVIGDDYDLDWKRG